MVSISAQHNKQNDILDGLVAYFAGTVAHLPEVKLDKLIYIAQLYHYSNFGELLTRTRFFSLSYGPHAPILRCAISRQLETNAIYLTESRTSSDPVYSNPCLIIRLCGGDETKLPRLCLHTLRGVIEDWGDKPYEQILDYTVRTVPYLSTAYRDPIDWTLIRPCGDLKSALSFSQRLRIHDFVHGREGTVRQHHDRRQGGTVTINEMAEIYLALSGAHPDKIPSREHLGFNIQAALCALDKLNMGMQGPSEQCSSSVTKAALMAAYIFNSMSFRSYSARVALKTAILYLIKSGHCIFRDALEEHWPDGYSYESLKEWFGKAGGR